MKRELLITQIDLSKKGRTQGFLKSNIFQG